MSIRSNNNSLLSYIRKSSAKKFKEMENEVGSASGFIKEERESVVDNEYPAYLNNSKSPRNGNQTLSRGMATVHYHPVSSTQTAEPENRLNEIDAMHKCHAPSQDSQQIILPRPTSLQKRPSSIKAGDYLDFVFWIRSLLLKLHPSLSELPEDMPLFSGLKWPDRHAWGRKVDEKCPTYWRRFRLKEAKRLSALSKRCFDTMISIGKRILRGDMKRSTISREAGSTTFDFLAKKTEEEMFHILTLIESGQLYIKDANAFTRSHREKRGPQNDDEFPEETGSFNNHEALFTASPHKQPRTSLDSPLGSSASDDLPTMAFSEDSRSEEMAASSTGKSFYRSAKNEEDGRLARVVEDLKDDLKDIREQLLKAQEKVHELEEENEVLSSLLTDNRAFQQQQQDIVSRRMKFKDDIIKRLRRDIRELTKNGVDKERNVETVKEKNSSDNVEGDSSQSEKDPEEYRDAIKVDDFVLYHTCNGKFYMGKVMDVSHQSGLLCIASAMSEDGITHDFSAKKTTFVSKDSVFRWGTLADVGASSTGEDLYRLTTEQTNLAT